MNSDISKNKSQKGKINYTDNLRKLASYRFIVKVGYAYCKKFDEADFLDKYPVNSDKEMDLFLGAGRADIGIFNIRHYIDFLKTVLFQAIIVLL